jgi:CheY-like chemotaxis protein
MELEQIECYPAEIAGEVVALLRDRAHQKNLAIQLESSPDVPRAVRSDPTRIRQILVNLVGNSVKFTHEGHVRIRVTAKRDDSPSRCIVQFSVIDTGIGIDPAQVASLFEPFAQGDTSHTRKYGGSGLGLAISKQLAGLMGGDLAVARGEDRGTCVTLSLPVMVVEPSAGESQVPAEPAPDVAGESPRAGLGRILLAEDTPDSRMLISLLISELGYSVDTAENGRIAVDKALETWRRGEPYAAILMDIQMPELDGYGATAELRDAGYEGPIVAVTAHAMGGSRERCLEAGCDDFLTKPINCEELAEILRAYLEKPGSAG